VLPTEELIDFLHYQLTYPAIEIGAGTGAIARALKIPATDSHMQERPEIKAYYESMGQPVIKYPIDVIKMDAETALKHYKPNTVVGAYITHKYNGVSGNMYGVVEGKILAAKCKYILIGNDTIHHDKPILKYDHKTLRFDWLVTRSQKEFNYIKIWQKE
jgi:cephalosporin hydroxylase